MTSEMKARRVAVAAIGAEWASIVSEEVAPEADTSPRDGGDLYDGRIIPPELRPMILEALSLGRRRLFDIWALASRAAAELHRDGIA